MTTKPSKAYLVREIEKEVMKTSGPFRILEMGCGTGSQLAMLVRAHPRITYVGIEPDAMAAEHARTHMGNRENVRVVTALAYDTGEDDKNSFDLVVSMSVLEHVKDLETFLKLSVACAKPGARVIHLYDLGHALHPSSVKERIQVMLCNHAFTRWLIPENKIAQYVSLDYVVKILKDAGASIDAVTYHNNKDTIARIQSNVSMGDDEVLRIAEKEVTDARRIADVLAREKIFPSVCIWAHKDI